MPRKNARSARGASSTPSVSTAFSAAVSKANPSRAQYAEARKGYKKIEELLLEHPDGIVKKTILTGSYARNTACLPLNDIDLLAVIRSPMSVQDVMESLTSFLDSCGFIVRQQKHSIGVKFNKPEPPRGLKFPRGYRALESVSFDVVPVLEDYQGMYWVAHDVGLQNWLPWGKNTGWNPTFPIEARQAIADANERNNGNLIPLLRLLKAWNSNSRSFWDGKKPFKSFYLEVLCYHQNFVLHGCNARERFAQLLNHVTSCFGVTVAAPTAGNVPSEPFDMPHRQQQNSLKTVAGLAAKAVAAENAGRMDDAHTYWVRALGDLYPVRRTRRPNLRRRLQPTRF